MGGTIKEFERISRGDGLSSEISFVEEEEKGSLYSLLGMHNQLSILSFSRRWFPSLSVCSALSIAIFDTINKLEYHAVCEAVG
jgi:hypothetical protein